MLLEIFSLLACKGISLRIVWIKCSKATHCISILGWSDANTSEFRPSLTSEVKGDNVRIARVSGLPLDVAMSLFNLSVSPDREHPNFRALRLSPYHDAARALMDGLFTRMGDPNGGFSRDFQSEGFYARLTELAWFAYLEEANAEIDRGADGPDFLVSVSGHRVALEVTTANPRDGDDRDISVQKIEHLSPDEIIQRTTHDFPSKILSSIRKKMNKGYSSLSQCQGRSIVIAIAPFNEPGSVAFIDELLVEAIYPIQPPHGRAFTKTPAFANEDSAHIAAIVFCNQMTVPRFLRIAHQNSSEKPLSGTRSGMAMRSISEDNWEAGPYRYRLDAGGHEERWSEGVTIFHNPFSCNPLPIGVLPCTSYFHCPDGGLKREVGDFHPLQSLMIVEVESEGADVEG